MDSPGYDARSNAFQYHDWRGSGSVPPTFDGLSPKSARMTPPRTGSAGPPRSGSAGPPRTSSSKELLNGGLSPITKNLQTKAQDLRKTQGELKKLISNLSQTQSVQSLQVEQAAKNLLKEAYALREAERNWTSAPPNLDLEFIAGFGHFLDSTYRNGIVANKKHVLPDGTMNLLLHAIFKLMNLRSNISVRITESVPHLFESIGNLIIREYKGSCWAAYLLAHLIRDSDGISNIGIHTVEAVINSAFKSIKDASPEMSSGCLLLINNFVAVGKDEVVLFIANHSSLAVILDQALASKPFDENDIRLQRILSIIHHLSRAEIVASILILKKVTEILYELKAAAARTLDVFTNQESPILGLTTMALSNLSPSIGPAALKADVQQLRIVVALLKSALEGKEYHGISFRIPDVLRALTHLCSYQQNQEILLELGLIELLQETLKQNADKGSASIAEACWVCASHLSENEHCVARMIEIEIAVQIERFLSTQEPDAWPEDTSKLLWILRDRPRLVSYCTEISLQTSYLEEVFKSCRYDNDAVRNFLEESLNDQKLIKSANKILEILKYENPKITELSTNLQQHKQQLREQETENAKVAISWKVMEEEKGMMQTVHARACQNLVNDLEVARRLLQNAETELEKHRTSSEVELLRLRTELSATGSHMRILQEAKAAESAALARVKAENDVLRTNLEHILEKNRQDSEKIEWLEADKVLKEREIQNLKEAQANFESMKQRLNVYEQELSQNAQAMHFLKAELEMCRQTLRNAVAKALDLEIKPEEAKDTNDSLTPATNVNDEQSDFHNAKVKGCLGISLSTGHSPYCVLGVYELMDRTGIVQGQPGYGNALVESGDELIEVDGKRVENLPFNNVMSFLRGAAGTLVQLCFRKSVKSEPGKSPRSLEIQIEALRHISTRKESPVRIRDGKPLTAAGVHLGMIGVVLDTGHCPFTVKIVDDLLDRNGIRQGQPGYLNDPIMIGDELIEVDGKRLESSPFNEVFEVLQGTAGSVAGLAFRRIEDIGLEKKITVIRISSLRHRPGHLLTLKAASNLVPEGVIKFGDSLRDLRFFR